MSFQSIVKELSNLTSAPIQISLPFEEDSQCCYFFQFHLITMCLREVGAIANLLELPIEEVFKCILLHEIGHSLDPQMEDLVGLFQQDELNEDMFISEVNAWRIADTLVDNQTYNYRLLRAWGLSNYDPDNQWIPKYCPDYFPK
jgi:hypothetical protein